MKSLNLRRTSNFQCRWSSNGQFLAIAYSHGLNIYDTESEEVVNHFTCADVVDSIAWSSDSRYILNACYKRSLVQVWSMEDPEWTCKIDEGSLGLIDAFWTPDGRHIMTVPRFHLRMTVWSLVNKSVSYLKFSKACNQGAVFSPDGKYFALLERRDCKDHVSLFLCSSWNMVTHFEPESKDAAGVIWSPAGDSICLWENALETYMVLLYSFSGHCMAKYSAYQWSLSIKSIHWSPTSQFLAIGSYDQKIRMLNHITWYPTIEYSHPTIILQGEMTVYKEIETNPLETDFSVLTDLSTLESKCYYETVADFPYSVPYNPPDVSKANPKYGVGTVAFSSNARYVASINDNMPTVLWIWDMDALAIAHCLVQQHPIKSVVWSLNNTQLALCTGNRRLYLWSPEGGASVHDLPDNVSFQATQVQWHISGASLIVMSKEHSCVLKIPAED